MEVKVSVHGTYKGGVIMDFSLNKEQLMIKQTFRDVAEKKIMTIVDEYEENEEFPEFLFPKLGELGYLGMTLPTEYGGMGADTITFCLFSEEFGKVNSGITSGFVVHSSVPVSAILQGGSEEQKKKYLSQAVSGESIFAIGITEPNVGSDVANIKTEAKSAENNYILNGSKVWITNGGIADYVVVAAREDGVSNLEGVQLFLVPTDTPGFQVANRMKKHGIQTSDTSELVFDNCKVPKENKLGDKGFYNILSSLTTGRIVVGARAVGVAEKAYELALNYSKQRYQFNKPIGKFQSIQHKLARMRVEIDAARLLVYKAAHLKDAGMEYSKEASIAKLYASEMAVRVTNEALHIHGSYGYSREYTVERLVRDARIFTIGEGTSEIQLNIIAKRLGL